MPKYIAVMEETTTIQIKRVIEAADAGAAAELLLAGGGDVQELTPMHRSRRILAVAEVQEGDKPRVMD